MEYEVLVMIHTGDAYSTTAKLRYAHPLNVDDIAVDNPELGIVMCHLGNLWITDCQEVLYKNSNVYSDISGLVVGDFRLSSATRYASKINDLLIMLTNLIVFYTEVIGLFLIWVPTSHLFETLNLMRIPMI